MDKLNVDFRAIRKRHRYSQQEFSQIMGVHVQTYYRWEKGQIRPPRSAQVLAYIIDRSPTIRDEVEQISGFHD